MQIKEASQDDGVPSLNQTTSADEEFWWDKEDTKVRHKLDWHIVPL